MTSAPRTRMTSPLPASASSRIIQILGTGLVYRNPKPYLQTICAMHPSLSVISEREWICTFDIGSAPESLDYHTVLARSMDQGATWTLESRLIRPGFQPPSTHSIRTARLRSGRILGIGALYHRTDQTEGIFNRRNLGAVPTDLFVVSSDDSGRTWSEPRVIQPPLASPGWEASHCPLELPDGRIGIPLGTWRGWDGELPCGQQTILMVSEDCGETWPVFHRIFDGRESGFIHWEQCVIARESDLLAIGWEYDPARQKNLPTVYATARTSSLQFSSPRRTGFLAETSEIAALGASEVLAVYRGAERPGLWSTRAEVTDAGWSNICTVPIWQGPLSRMDGKANHADELADLKFGSPSLQVLPGGEVLVAFWCQEDGITNIRWIRLGVS